MSRYAFIDDRLNSYHTPSGSSKVVGNISILIDEMPPAAGAVGPGIEVHANTPEELHEIRQLVLGALRAAGLTY